MQNCRGYSSFSAAKFRIELGDIYTSFSMQCDYRQQQFLNRFIFCSSGVDAEGWEVWDGGGCMLVRAGCIMFTGLL